MNNVTTEVLKTRKCEILFIYHRQGITIHMIAIHEGNQLKYASRTAYS
jgi:hypothetical protein